MPASSRRSRREGLGLRLFSALAARSGRFFGLASARLMAARTRDLKGVSRVPPAFTVRAAGPADEPCLASFIGDAGKAASLLASGDVGLLATADGRIHAMEWIRPGPADYDWDGPRLGLVFGVPARGCWLHNGSGGSIRILGAWGIVLRSLPVLLEEREIEVAYLQVASDDRYSLQCHESLGFREVARVVALRLPGWRLVALRMKGQKWARFRSERLDLDRLPA